MGNVRIQIRNSIDTETIAALDNLSPKGIHYSNDKLTRYFEGDASVLQFDAMKQSEDVQYLKVGNRLAFIWQDKEYSMTIMDTVETEYKVIVTAMSLCLELNNEDALPYTPPRAMSFAEYLDVFDFEKVLTLNINEVSDKRITHTFEDNSNLLGRMYTLASVFDAEIEFSTFLNDDYSVKTLMLNVYKKHSDTNQGLGLDKRGQSLRFGKEITTISKNENIEDLYTAIRPTGAEGLNLKGMSRQEKDDNGNIIYELINGAICAVQARLQFPSTVFKGDDMYITRDWQTEYKTQETLYGNALAELKKHCVPKVEYEVEGYFDTAPGDTVTIENDQYKPTLILEARVIEQTESFTDPRVNSTKFSNFKEVEANIDQSLLGRVQELIDENKTYEYQLVSTNGTIFKNGEGETTLTAKVLDGTKDITDSQTIKWLKDGTEISTGKSITISAEDVDGRAVYRYEATDGKRSGGFEVTVVDISDGEPGDPGVSIVSVKEYFAVSESEVTPPTVWEEVPQTMTPVLKYSWSYTVTTFSDGHVDESLPRVIGVYGDAGPPGDDGEPGISTMSVADYYLITDKDTGITIASEGWVTQPGKTTSTLKYMWHYSRTTYTNYSYYDTTPAIISTHGDTGLSLTITSSTVMYQTSSSGTSVPTGTWVTNPPTIPVGQYLWTRTKVVYSDNNETVSYSISRNGESATIESEIIMYKASDQGTTPPTGTWYADPPDVAPGYFLWTRIQVTYSDTKKTTSHTVTRYGDDGIAGTDAITLVIMSSKGTIFKNSAIATVLTAKVYEGAKEVTGSALTDLGVITWYMDDVEVGKGVSYTVVADTIDSKANFEARLEDKANNMITLAKVDDKKPVEIRYIRDWLNGNSVDNTNRWVECEAWVGEVNVARGLVAKLKGQDKQTQIYEINVYVYTDGITSGEGTDYYCETTDGKNCLELDLGTVRKDIDYFKIYHYNEDGRIFNHKLEVSADGLNWVTLFDSDEQGGYIEDHEGRTVIISDTYLNRAIVTIEKSVEGLAIDVRNAEGKISSLEIGAGEIVSRVEQQEQHAENTDDSINQLVTRLNELSIDIEGNMTEITQTINSIVSKVTKVEEDTAKLVEATLDADGWKMYISRLGMYEGTDIQQEYTNIIIDINGIHVENPDTGQKTIISTTEFAGYDGDKKAFWLDRDELKTVRLYVDNGIDFRTIKYVPQTVTYNGQTIGGLVHIKSGGSKM